MVLLLIYLRIIIKLEMKNKIKYISIDRGAKKEVVFEC
jgi:hypothetical protein